MILTLNDSPVWPISARNFLSLWVIIYDVISESTRFWISAIFRSFQTFDFLRFSEIFSETFFQYFIFIFSKNFFQIGYKLNYTVGSFFEQLLGQKSWRTSSSEYFFRQFGHVLDFVDCFVMQLLQKECLILNQLLRLCNYFQHLDLNFEKNHYIL